MKKLLLFSAALLTAGVAFSQQRSVNPTSPLLSGVEAVSVDGPEAVGDTIIRRNTDFSAGQDTATYYNYDVTLPLDTGFVTGYNRWNDRQFAERYDMSGADSTVRLIGVRAYLFGRATATSTKTVKFKGWRQGNRTLVTGTTRTYFNGKPTTGIDSLTVNLVNMRQTAAAANGRVDTFYTALFTNPTNTINDSFFVGVDFGNVNYASLGGDTLNLVTTRQGERRTFSPVQYMQGTDSILNVQNAVYDSANRWLDQYWQNSGLRHHFVAYAIIRVQSITGLIENGLTNDDLTFYGSFPNPARTTSTVRFALKNTADVHVDMTDMTGRVVRSINRPRTATGQHDVEVPVSGLAAGQYIMSVRTSEGGAIGVQVIVAQ